LPDDNKALAGPGNDLAGLRALIVDTNWTACTILHRYASAAGMSTSTTDSAERALDMLRSAHAGGEPYDLALIDMKLPDMNGMELAGAIAAETALSATRVILLSSLTAHDTAESADHGGVAHLNKPVRRGELYQCIAGVMGAAARETALTLAAAAANSLRGARVLLVEDNCLNQEICAAMLDSLGCDAEVVDDGRAGVDAVLDRQYDIVLMDCQMPNMDGFEATRLIRKLELERSAKRVPIIALTANAMEGDRDRCIAAGMDDYVSKPFKKDALRATLELWTGRDASARGPAADAAARRVREQTRELKVVAG
jgi:CheY-like chemotaxis protein